MFKKMSQTISAGVKVQTSVAGNVIGGKLNSYGFTNTGGFVEKQIVGMGEDSGTKIEIVGQTAQGTTKVISGFLTNNPSAKEEGLVDLHEATDRVLLQKAEAFTETVINVETIGNGVLTRDAKLVKDGASNLIGLKKSAVGLNVLDDFGVFRKK